MASDNEPMTDNDDPWAAALAEQAASGSDEGAAAAVEATAVQTTTVERASDASHLFPRLSGSGPDTSSTPNDIDMILDIPVQLTVELGRTRIPIKHILQLAQGSVIELDALAGEPMDVLVNGCLIAQGEVVVVNEKFGIRLTDIVTPSERMRRLNRV
ncbi:MAG: flagellar motor switch protein FliN [Burkholderiaceae bacterium]